MTRWIFVLGLCVALAAAAPGPAGADEPPESDDPGELALEGVQRLMRALEAIIEMIPQYEMPEMNEDGDIIIRRKRGDEPEEPEEEPDVDQTRT